MTSPQGVLDRVDEDEEVRHFICGICYPNEIKEGDSIVAICGKEVVWLMAGYTRVCQLCVQINEDKLHTH